MKYIINLNFVFNAQDRLLTLKNDNNISILLSKPATRLLCELITNNNTTLFREDIIKAVWTDYGFTPSTASLSNHISELRKAFESI
ncbi:MAG: winged helix-turn-helix domain-containing protein, partial [Serratia proteamaculans]